MPQETIVLLHGMGRTRGSMRKAAGWLAREGWRTLRIGYPSLRKPIEQLALDVAHQLESAGESRLHFVTHSLGGLVLRRLLFSHRPASLGRVVMLAPPNRGSRLARRIPGASRVVPAVRQLAQSPEALERLLGPIDYELLVVAGSRAAGPLHWITAESNDGVVTVDETLARGCSATLVVPRGHTFLMNSEPVLRAVHRFLRYGATDGTAESIEKLQLIDRPDGVSSGRSNSSRIVDPESS